MKRPLGSAFDHLGSCLNGKFAADVDWLPVITLANQHLVSPHLYRSICAAGVVSGLDSEILEYLADIDAANRERNQRVLTQIAELASAMTEADIGFMVIKGAAALINSMSFDLSPRMLHDVDLLINFSDAEMTNFVLRKLGYDIFPDSCSEHSSGSYFRLHDVAAVDVHIRLPDRFREIVTSQDLEVRTRLVPLGESWVRVPDTNLQFAINLAHEMLHDRGLWKGFTELRYLFELIELARDEEDPIDWDWISQKAHVSRFGLGLELQARMAEDLAGFAALPFPRRTLLGRVLHERRRLKLRFPQLGELEWKAINAVRITRGRYLIGVRSH